MKIKELRARLLVAILNAHRKHGFSNYIDPQQAAADASLQWEPGMLSLCIEGFGDRGLLQDSRTMGGGPDGGHHCRLTDFGVEEAEETEEAWLETKSKDRSAGQGRHIVQNFYENLGFEEQFSTDAPASDRYVEFSDNQRDELVSATKTLQNAVSDDRSNDFDDKEEKLVELAALEMILSQPRVSAALLENMLMNTVGNLARRFADKAIGDAATALWNIGMILLGKSL